MILTYEDYEPQFGIFRDLIKFRVRNILLVSSFYDAFVLEEDGRLSDKIFSEYIDLNLRFIPKIVRVSSAEDALRELNAHSFDLVITMTRIADMNPYDFGLKVKDIKPDLPIILLTYEWIDEELLVKFRKSECINKVFYWTGDTRILLAIIKYIEDLINIDNDISLGVRVVLIIEDSPKFYSQFLPLMYTEIMTQTRLLISEGVNDLHRLLRMRARPKILLAENYEQGMSFCNKYQKNLLGIISDVKFQRKNKMENLAGFHFAKHIKSEIPDLPILMQSSNIKNQKRALDAGLGFLYKNSDNFLHDLQQFILSNFGFGDFVFKDSSGKEVGRAKNLHEFEKMIQIIPDESLKFHAKKNHISIWLRARTEFEVADRLRPKKVSDFDAIGDLRAFIVQEIQKLKQKNQSGVITDFTKSQFDYKSSFIRLGNGSLGGKARGIAFINAMLAKTKLGEKFKGVEIKTPQTFVISSEVFEEFIHSNRLQEFAILEMNNDIIAQKFLQARLPASIVNDLSTLLINVKYPLAVRSSSILEDSQTLPFAGLYSTFMLPNNHPDNANRLIQLSNAIKLVYASVFNKSPKEYVRNTNFRIEEERMAVIIQKLVGQNCRDRFYPVVSGVAQSYNFYPISHMKPKDGIVQLALGLGLIIVGGTQTFRFSPKYPKMNPIVSSAADLVDRSQSYFYALDLSDPDLQINTDEKYSLLKLDLADAEMDGTLFFVSSTYSPQDNAIRDTISIPGARVLTFANILKYDLFPLADILAEILEVGRTSFGSHVEIEFAINLFADKERIPEFNWLQIRPMVAGRETLEISIDKDKKDELFCLSEHAIGNGVYNNLKDVVYVDPDTFDPAASRIIAHEIGILNQNFIKNNCHYIIFGFGRWGTSDPWLGIPVEWFQISKAKLMIEANLADFKVDPSQGSHFFHNMISLKMGYFHVKEKSGDDFIDWQWLKSQKPVNQTKYVKHISFNRPLTIMIDARTSTGAISKP